MKIAACSWLAVALVGCSSLTTPSDTQPDEADEDRDESPLRMPPPRALATVERAVIAQIVVGYRGAKNIPGVSRSRDEARGVAARLRSSITNMRDFQESARHNSDDATTASWGGGSRVV